MLVFSDHGNTARVSYGDKRIVLTEDEVTQAWCQMARMHDSLHSGNAELEVGNHSIRLSDEQWRTFYDGADEFLNKFFWAEMLEDGISLH